MQLSSGHPPNGIFDYPEISQIENTVAHEIPYNGYYGASRSRKRSLTFSVFGSILVNALCKTVADSLLFVFNKGILSSMAGKSSNLK